FPLASQVFGRMIVITFTLASPRHVREVRYVDLPSLQKNLCFTGRTTILAVCRGFRRRNNLSGPAYLGVEHLGARFRNASRLGGGWLRARRFVARARCCQNQVAELLALPALVFRPPLGARNDPACACEFADFRNCFQSAVTCFDSFAAQNLPRVARN